MITGVSSYVLKPVVFFILCNVDLKAYKLSENVYSILLIRTLIRYKSSADISVFSLLRNKRLNLFLTDDINYLHLQRCQN